MLYLCFLVVVSPQPPRPKSVFTWNKQPVLKALVILKNKAVVSLLTVLNFVDDKEMVIIVTVLNFVDKEVVNIIIDVLILQMVEQWLAFVTVLFTFDQCNVSPNTTFQ